MGADEARTVRDLKGHQTVVRPMIADYGGRVIDTAGILAELGSVVKRGPVRDRHPGDDGQAQTSETVLSFQASARMAMPCWRPASPSRPTPRGRCPAR